jgi:hypothetical protein
MSRRAVILIGLLAAVSLGIGIFWTIRLAPPSPTPWWWGKNPKVQVEIWEPGKDMATVAMRMPKSFFDSIIALGLPAIVQVNGKNDATIGFVFGQDLHSPVRLNTVWKQLERLPRGEKLKLEQDGATVILWIDAGP